MFDVVRSPEDRLFCDKTHIWLVFRMISSCKTAEEVTELSKTGQKLFNLVENSDRPVVAAINGSCLGGGLEVSKK